MRLVFYPAQGGKVWNGQTLNEEGLGGSETAVIYLARELATLGHEVIVFTRAKPGIYDGVAYVAWERARNLLRTLRCDALICVRDPLPLIWSTQASLKVFWAHDLPQPGGALPGAHAYWFVSNLQRAIYIQNNIVPRDRTHLVPNGVDLALFREEDRKPIAPLTKKSDVTLAWTSNPERGLWYAGEVLQAVQKEYPKAELHVWGRNAVYGWDAACEHNFHPETMRGVILHQPLPKHELARALSHEADLWVYPTWWPETYCIAAVEAQAAGVPVVASSFAALQETVQGGMLIEGWAGCDHHEEFMQRTIDATLSLLHNPAMRRAYRDAGLTYAATQTWAASARAAVDNLSHLLGVQAA